MRIVGLEPKISCVRDRDDTTRPQRHRSLHWTQFMLQWFLRFSEFTEFSESSAPFRENPNDVKAIHFVTKCEESNLNQQLLYWQSI